MMKALIFDPNARRGLRFGEVVEPKPTAAQALVEVHAISLNWGELSFLDHMHKPWGCAGLGRCRGRRSRGGRWVRFAAGNSRHDGRLERSVGEAPRRRHDELASLPADMDFGVASTLPAAGVTALRALRSLGSVVGRRVLVTGASGGVGGYAVQLARRAGAHVVASVSGEGRGEAFASLGRARSSSARRCSEPFYGVLDNVGGPVLTERSSSSPPGERLSA